MARAPLAGKTVVVTRAREQAAALAQELENAGARVLLAPLIRAAPPSSYAALDAALRRLAVYDAVVFTSRNGVEAFFGRARALGLKRLPKPRLLGAIGPATAAALRERRWKAAAVPEKGGGEELARALGCVRGKRILIPRATVAREALPALLRRAGATVEVVEAYRTLRDGRGAARLKEAQGIDAVTFTSGSTVRHFWSALGKRACARLFESAAAVSIGPVTSAALLERGVKAVQAERPSTRGLLTALKERLGGP